MTNIMPIKSKKPKIWAGIIIQARMTSKRFPGKSMVILHGKPVLQWCLENVLKMELNSRLIKQRVILAVPDTPESEPMLQLAESLNVDNFCGSELNVLSRYYHAARFFNLRYIVRITADCPFIDPIVCSQVLQLLLWWKLDYASNCYPVRTYPKGLDCEAFTFDCLEAAYKLSNQIGDWEHVTPWMRRTEGLKKGALKQKIDMSEKNYCVDYPEDIERLEKEIPIKGKIKIIGEAKND